VRCTSRSLPGGGALRGCADRCALGHLEVVEKFRKYRGDVIEEFAY
jgi:hypothetical protein